MNRAVNTFFTILLSFQAIKEIIFLIKGCIHVKEAEIKAACRDPQFIAFIKGFSGEGMPVLKMLKEFCTQEARQLLAFVIGYPQEGVKQLAELYAL